MKESRIKRITLVLSLLGLVSLCFISDYSEPEEIYIINAEKNIDRKVILSGEIENFVSRNTVTFFDLKDNTGKIKVVSFEDIYRVKKCSYAKVTGDISLYKGDLEIIAEKIECY